MLGCTSPDSLKLILDFVSPLVDALVLAIGVSVVRQTRSTSEAVQSTSQVAELNSLLLHRLLGRNVSPPDAPGRKK